MKNTPTVPDARKKGTSGLLWTKVPKEQQTRFRAAKLRTNVGRMYAFSIYVIAVQVILNVINIVKPADSKSSDINIYVILSMATLAVGIIYWLLLLLARRGRIKSRAAKLFLTESLLYLYLVIQLVFCTLNIISTGGVNSYIIAILIVGLFPIIHPLQSGLTILFSFVYVLFASYFTRDISSTWDSILLTDTWTNLIIITGLIVCISAFMYRLYVSNFLQSMSLREVNVELMRTNEELADANNQLEVLARTDQMTGVLNRRALSEDFEILWRLSQKKQARLAVAIMDIDFFKYYNDTFGHMEGDACLRKIAASLRNSFRRTGDMVCRYGGEEFLAIFEADEEGAFAMVERARKAVEDLKIPHANTEVSPYVTISAGVCVMAPGGELTTDQALKVADAALYESKNSGRNKTTLKALEPVLKAEG